MLVLYNLLFFASTVFIDTTKIQAIVVQCIKKNLENVQILQKMTISVSTEIQVINMTTDEAIKYITDFEKNLYDACVIKETIANNELMRTLEAFDFAIKELKHDRWISCSERLPEERIDPITFNYYEYPCTFKCGKIAEVRYFKFGEGHWWNGPGIMDKYIIAWRPLLEPYKEPQNED